MLFNRDRDATKGKGGGAVGSDITESLATSSLRFIGEYFPAGPNVEKVGGRINDGVPGLVDAAFIPSLQGLVQFAFTSGAVRKPEESSPCGPNVGGGLVLAWVDWYGLAWGSVAVHCPLTDSMSDAVTNISQGCHLEVEAASLGMD